MFGKLGKQYAAQVADKIEEMTLDALNERRPPQEHNTKSGGASAKTTEKLHKINGRRKAVFIGINYVGQKNELK